MKSAAGTAGNVKGKQMELFVVIFSSNEHVVLAKSHHHHIYVYSMYGYSYGWETWRRDTRWNKRAGFFVSPCDIQGDFAIYHIIQVSIYFTNMNWIYLPTYFFFL